MSTAVRVALYLRVSTKRQAEHDLSIPDQRKQLEAYCFSRDWEVAKEYVEPGASGTTDNRPAFQDMIADGRAKPRLFDTVLVHSFSRMARDAYQLEYYVRDLRKRGVRLVSVTQETGDDPSGELVRKIFAMFDEYQSQENAKHTLRAMKENARQGYWNGGSAPPFGYRTLQGEKRGDKIKRRLEPEPLEAEMVRKVFRLYLNGDGAIVPLGVKAIAIHLNAQGTRQRGRRFSNNSVYRILRETAYIGTYYFNRRDSRAKTDKPESEWIAMPCPSIVDKDTFASVQRKLTERNPKRTPGRVSNNPILLSGMVKCAHCRGTMGLRTGKSGKYRYYACIKQAKEGADGCKGCSVPMAQLDTTVTDALIDRVLDPTHMTALVRELKADTAKSEKADTHDRHSLEVRFREADLRVTRLFDALENGTVTDSDIFRSRLAKAQAERQEALRLLTEAQRRTQDAQAALSPKKVAAFSKGMADLLRTGDIQFRKAFLRTFVNKVELLDGEVRISGSKDVLSAALEAGLPPPGAGVPSLVQEWRARRDSNS
ncbi:MAG: recombinase family protein [Rhodospirillaceae bacterium]|nr:recombinase family protein [Rhodospirillaceae bacterium]